MRAITVSSFGAAEVLTATEVPDPEPNAGEVTIDVDFAAVGLVDAMVRRGAFPLVLPVVPGLSVAGRIRALGTGVTGLTPGQPVAAFTALPAMGGYATIARARAALAVPLETRAGTITAEKGAVAIVNGPTAYLALTDLGGVRPGDPVVVHGATGALGGMVAQIAHHLGARPLIGIVGSALKRPHAVALGYTDVFLSSDNWPAGVRQLTGGRGAAVVVDPVGGPMRQASLDALRPLGRLIVVGHASDTPDPGIPPTDLWLGNQAILGLNIGALSAVEPEPFQMAARAVFALIAEGAVRADIGGMLPLTESAEAHRQLEARHVLGTLLLHTRAGQMNG